MNRSLLILSLTTCGIALACDTTLKDHETTLPSKMELVLYDGPRVATSVAIGSHHPFARTVQSWLDGRRDGWRRDWNSYAPTVKLVSDRLTITLLEDGRHVVLNFIYDDGSSRQLSRSVGADDAARMLAAAAAS